MDIKRDKDDASLWNRFLDGDREAYAYIFERYVRVLFMYGSQFTGDRELVKDCIQDVFVKIYSNRSNLRPTDNIKYYLFAALRNSLINVLKRDKARFGGGGDSDTDAKAKEQAYEDASRIIEIREEEAIMQNRVAEIMSALTPQQKRAVHYRYIDNLSISEISDVMNMSYQAVLNTIQRALKRIRTNYLN